MDFEQYVYGVLLDEDGDPSRVATRLAHAFNREVNKVEQEAEHRGFQSAIRIASDTAAAILDQYVKSAKEEAEQDAVSDPGEHAHVFLGDTACSICGYSPFIGTGASDDYSGSADDYTYTPPATEADSDCCECTCPHWHQGQFLRPAVNPDCGVHA